LEKEAMARAMADLTELARLTGRWQIRTTCRILTRRCVLGTGGTPPPKAAISRPYTGGIPMNCVRQSFPVVVAAICAAVASASAGAAPVTYLMDAITDVSLGDDSYHMAQVRLKFVGDTQDAAYFNVTTTGHLFSNQAIGYLISKGRASLEIRADGRRVTAHFLPNQLFVSLDQYNGGVGFGAYVGADHHLEPAYPLAIDFCCSGALFTAPDLATPTSYTGHAWSCIGFPVTTYQGGTGYCTDPAGYPLKTDRGDFYIQQPYLSLNPDGSIYDDYGGSVNNGIFSIVLGADED
jgi:hypothetical protein